MFAPHSRFDGHRPGGLPPPPAYRPAMPLPYAGGPRWGAAPPVPAAHGTPTPPLEPRRHRWGDVPPTPAYMQGRALVVRGGVVVKRSPPHFAVPAETLRELPTIPVTVRSGERVWPPPRAAYEGRAEDSHRTAEREWSHPFFGKSQEAPHAWRSDCLGGERPGEQYLGKRLGEIGPHEPPTTSDRLPRWLEREYWGGRGYAGGDMAPVFAPIPPKDSLDKCFEAHDKNYHGVGRMTKGRADWELLKALGRLPLRSSDWDAPPDDSLEAQRFRVGAMGAFAGMLALRAAQGKLVGKPRQSSQAPQMPQTARAARPSANPYF